MTAVEILLVLLILNVAALGVLYARARRSIRTLSARVIHLGNLLRKR